MNTIHIKLKKTMNLNKKIQQLDLNLLRVFQTLFWDGVVSSTQMMQNP